LLGFFVTMLQVSQNCDIVSSGFQLAISQNCDTMSLWSFKGFIKTGGANIVQEWCRDADDVMWEAFVAHCEYLGPRPITAWVMPYTRMLGGGKRSKKNCTGLVEFRFDVGNVEYRPLGFYSGKMEFTFLFFAEEHDGEFVPPNACQIAKERMGIIEADWSRAREFRL
jgi:hypothetical protein